MKSLVAERSLPAAIAKDLADLLFSSAAPIAANLLVTAIIGAALLFDQIALWPVAWAAVNAVVCGGRFWLRRSYRRQPPETVTPRRYIRACTWLITVSGVLWGLLGLAVGIVPTPMNALVVPILVFAVAASLASTHTAHLPTIRGFIYPACLLTGIGLALQGDAPHLLVVLLDAIFLINLDAVSRRAYAAVVQTLLAKRAAARSQEQLARAQQVAATGSAEWDLETGEEEWSDEMYRLWGRTRESFALTDANILASIHEEDRAMVAAARTAHRAGEPTRSGEFRVVRPDGEIRALYAEIDIQRDATGKAVRALSIIKDVTDLRAAESSRRDAELRLLHAQKLEAIGTLAGGVAHEINNALVPTIALTKMVAAKLPEPSRERRNLFTAIAGAERARDLVAQILAFARRQAPQQEPLALAQLVAEAVHMMRATLPATIAISEQLGDAIVVVGDGNQLTQVVVNLINNAAQAIGQRMGTIAVSLATADGDTARLDIVDDGCGMDETTRARIFEPFFTTKDVGSGTGLGLSIVHGIVETHGGRIEVESRPGAGSRFSVLLPLAAAAAQPLQRTA